MDPARTASLSGWTTVYGPPTTNDLDAARRRDEAAFVRLVAPHRAELQAHCYRMLGSMADAEDALQEAMLRAWRGLPGFEGRSALRSWLYRIATNVCLRLIEQRSRRTLPVEHGSPSTRPDAEAPLAEQVWIGPYPDETIPDERPSPEARYELRESVELAFIAALQHLPGRQRAVLLLRDVLGFAPAEIAETLETTPASVYSALQRAHVAVDERLPARSQHATLQSLADTRLRDLVRRYLSAWEANDVESLVGLLAADATWSMPPRPTWFRGRADISAFLARWPLAPSRRWRLVRVPANGQLSFAVYEDAGAGRYVAHGIEVLTLDETARITDVVSFLDAGVPARFGLPWEIPAQATDGSGPSAGSDPA